VTAPWFVAAEPRYVQRTSEIWHLDGVDWFDAPAPVQRGHEHWAQTAGWLGLDLVCRCPCSAITRRYPDGWIHLDEPRFAEPPRRGAAGGAVQLLTDPPAKATVVGSVVGIGLAAAWVFLFTAILDHENPLNWPAALVAPVLFFGSIWLSERTATALTRRHEETP
jgi:hypothetical protein